MSDEALAAAHREPQTVTVEISPASRPPLYEQESPAHLMARQLGSYLRSIEKLLDDEDFDEAAEILVATKGYEGFDRARFKKVGAALSLIGSTIQGNPTKTVASAVADKYCRKPRPH